MGWITLFALAAWELPQNALGAFVLGGARLLGNVVSVTIESKRVFVRTRSVGVSLGAFVFWFERG